MQHFTPAYFVQITELLYAKAVEFELLHDKFFDLQEQMNAEVNEPLLAEVAHLAPELDTKLQVVFTILQNIKV